MGKCIKLNENTLHNYVHQCINEWFKEPSEPKKVLICNSTIDGYEANEIAMSEGYEKEWMGAKFWFEGTIDYESEFEPQDMPKYNQFITHMDEVDADLYYDYGANYYFAVREGNNGKNSLLQYNENKQITKSKLHKIIQEAANSLTPKKFDRFDKYDYVFNEDSNKDLKQVYRHLIDVYNNLMEFSSIEAQNIGSLLYKAIREMESLLSK